MGSVHSGKSIIDSCTCVHVTVFAPFLDWLLTMTSRLDRLNLLLPSSPYESARSSLTSPLSSSPRKSALRILMASAITEERYQQLVDYLPYLPGFTSVHSGKSIIDSCTCVHVFVHVAPLISTQKMRTGQILPLDSCPLKLTSLLRR